MTNQSEMMQLLITKAYDGPVFGPDKAFGEGTADRLQVVQHQIAAIAGVFNADMYAIIKNAMPALLHQDIQRILQEIGPKAVGFCPALTAGELPGDEYTKRLAAAAKAIGIMYFADQSMDRGDELMSEAINCAFGDGADKPALYSRVAALRRIKAAIAKFALEEDLSVVRDCYEHQVLYNEVVLHRHSLSYQSLDKAQQAEYLQRNATELAELMVVDAGFPSVTASLYAIYRQHDTTLAPLRTVHNDPVIRDLLQVCNAVVRIADELGDWEIDAGKHPEWGVFAINPLNQYHPDLVDALCQLAFITDSALLNRIQEAFRNFHKDAATRKKYGHFLTNTLFGHVRHYIEHLPAQTLQRHALYVTLCKRVLEIGHVNMMGDKALAGL